MARGPRVVPIRTGWQALLRRDDKGRVIADIANALIALRNEPGFAGGMAFNEMYQKSFAMAEWPAPPNAVPIGNLPHEVSDDDVSRLQEYLQVNGIWRIGREITRDAIDVFAHERPYHPLRDWLTGLKWDGVSRLESWLSECLGCPEDEYHRQIGSMFLIAMVARIFRPGCKSDYLISLEGPQGEEKSKFCRALAGGDEYFSDSLPPIDGDHVRLSMHLRGKWLIEVAELAAMLKADPEGVKHFISRQSERYTPKFGRSEVIELRQCLFIGTTNDDEYIRDATGGRRYWPVVVVHVRLDRLEALREQLFAEAVHAFNAGQPWWPDREFEKSTITPVQDERQWEDAWTEKVGEHLTARGFNGGQTTIAEVAEFLGVDNAHLDRVTQRRIADILRKPYNWRKVRSTGGHKVWRFP